MLTLHATDDFAMWYGALSDDDAEDVARGIGLIEALGPERAAPGSSELLLWYQCPEDSRGVLRYGDLDGEFASRFRRIIHHLESKLVMRRLSEVSSERARSAHKAIGSLIVRARWRHLYDKREAQTWADVQAQYRSLLDVLGIDEPTEEASNAALRQLDFCKRRPAVRVVYGVDAPRRRALLVLGESLDRSAYGPSVRKALAQWAQFLRGDAEVGAAPSEIRSNR